jgi:hypothetical protein
MMKNVIDSALTHSRCEPGWPGTGPDHPATRAPGHHSNFPAVTFGVVSFLQYAAELHEQDGYNAFDVTRGISTSGAAQ